MMLSTQRNVPAEAEIVSHQLLLRGGFVRRVTSGIYAYMPLMWKTLQKITTIVQEEMDTKGALQTLLPQLHPADIWRRSDRWEGYTAGEGIMFNLKDRQGRELGLAPTHEEVITTITGEIINSYKQLPINLYQIQTKFRDEIRPRFGLMRSREFIMKDAYSFHQDELDLKSTYEDMNDAYKRIFYRCGLKTVAVDADSGAIGGSASQEFMVTAESGEDLILISSDETYAANQEKAISKYSKAIESNYKEFKIIATPNQKSIKDLCIKQNIDPSQIVKVIIMLAILKKKGRQPILISIRGDQELNEVKLSNEISKHLKDNLIDLISITNDDLKKENLNPLPFGSIGPDLENSFLKGAKTWNREFIRLADVTASELTNFVCGSNKKDEHRAGVNWDLIGNLPEVIDIRKAKAGDQCVHDNTKVLKECRGIEVGHIFQLGCKYSQSLDASFTNKDGIEKPFWMGCYGIGISRLAQAAVEQNNDEQGIIWPISIAPFEVIVTVANMKDLNQKICGEKLYKNFKEYGIDVLFDDRNERAGIKFKDADLIGIPWRVIVGRDSISNKVELYERSTRKTKLLEVEVAIQKLIEEIKAQRREFDPTPN